MRTRSRIPSRSNGREADPRSVPVEGNRNRVQGVKGSNPFAPTKKHKIPPDWSPIWLPLAHNLYKGKRCSSPSDATAYTTFGLTMNLVADTRFPRVVHSKAMPSSSSYTRSLENKNARENFNEFRLARLSSITSAIQATSLASNQRRV